MIRKTRQRTVLSDPNTPRVTQKVVTQYYVEVPKAYVCKGPFATKDEAYAFLKVFERQWYLPEPEAK